MTKHLNPVSFEGNNDRDVDFRPKPVSGPKDSPVRESAPHSRRGINYRIPLPPADSLIGPSRSEPNETEEPGTNATAEKASTENLTPIPPAFPSPPAIGQQQQ